MPADKVKNSQWRVGLLALVAMGILGVLIFLLTGSKPLFRDEVNIYTYLDDSAALAVGSPVRLNGILIGEVSAVDLTGSKTPGRNVKVTMGVDRASLRLMPVDSLASISAENLLGTKYINISQGTSATLLKEKGEIPAANAPEIGEILRQGNNIAVGLQGLLKRVDAIVAQVESGEGNIGKLIKDETLYRSLVSTVGEINALAKQLNNEDSTLGKFIYSREMYDDLRQSLVRVDGLLAGLERGEGTAGKFLKDPRMYDEARQSLTELRVILADLNAGKGTAGQLLKDDKLAKQIGTTIDKVNVTIDQLNEGRGTLGQLLVNPALYENLNGTIVETRGLIGDIRKDPRKYLRIKLSLF